MITNYFQHNKVLWNHDYYSQPYYDDQSKTEDETGTTTNGSTTPTSNTRTKRTITSSRSPGRGGGLSIKTCLDVLNH